MGYKVAVIGATGNVGREIFNTLYERQFPVDEIHALASEKSTREKVAFGDDEFLPVKDVAAFDFKGIDLVFASAGAKASRVYGPKAAKQGAIYIDNSSAFRMEPGVPLVVPEVNEDALAKYINKNIIASPNCIAIPLTVVLKPLHDIVPLNRVVISTYQAVSGAGRQAMDELFSQTKAVFMNASKDPEHFPKPIAFNVIPHIDHFDRDGNTGEETKIIQETRKILDGGLKVFATCVRVPVFNGHSIAVTLECDGPLSVVEARKALQNAPGVTVVDRPQEDGYITPLDCNGEDEVYVSRLRQDPTVDHGLSLWICNDNLRKGAALNTVQIAESLIENYL